MIKILDSYTAERIAAGEVVERPFSVVKELLENSIDAKSTSIFIDLTNGGFTSIKITDNGCGMTGEELSVAIKRFATSRISSFEVLSALSSLGFRGEALPSIASVSQMEIMSSVDGITANSIVVNGGKIIDAREAAMDKGTSVTVNNLFFNTPARKKFQKSAATELLRISSLVSSLALSRRDIHFRLRHNEKTVLNYPVNMTEKDILLNLWDLEDSSYLKDFYREQNGISVRGVLASPDATYSTRNGIITFVNGRIVKNYSLCQSITDGFGKFITSGRYPLALVFIDVPAHTVDVNVHPSKTEIRFDNFKELGAFLTSSVSDTVKLFRRPDVDVIEKAFSLPERSFSLGSVDTASAWNDESSFKSKSSSFYDSTLKKGLNASEDKDAYQNKLWNAYHLDEKTQVIKENKTQTEVQTEIIDFLPLAQVYKTYIIGLLNGELILIDQHAAHEKIIYESLAKDDDVEKQRLLIDFVLEFNTGLSKILEDNLTVFTELGFEIEPFGQNTFRISAVPFYIANDDIKQFFKDVLERISEEGLTKEKDYFEKIRYTMACKSAIKANESLSFIEMKALFNKLMMLKEPFFCPHGRPVMYKLSQTELEKIFKRRQ